MRHGPAPIVMLVAGDEVQGRRMHTIESCRMAMGDQALRWDGLDDAGQLAASGAYFARVE